jgi:hypothetical protein
VITDPILSGRADFNQAGLWRVKDLKGLGLRDRVLDGSPQSLRQIVSLLLKIARYHVEAPVGSETMTCTLMLDALATVQAPGVTQEGHVTGVVRDLPLELKVEKLICSDPEA